jgi:hypothetical protein
MPDWSGGKANPDTTTGSEPLAEEPTPEEPAQDTSSDD